MKVLYASFVLRLLTTGLFALDDSPENRAKMAEHYLQVVPVQERTGEIVDKFALYIPEPQRAMFKSMMTKHLDFKVVVAATQQALVKTFTAEELQAMSDFYSTSAGKSISQKLGYYMSNMMPALQLEMTRAAQAAASEMKQDVDQ